LSVAINSSIKAYFSEELDPTTITQYSFYLSDGASGNVNYGNKVLTLAPIGQLLANHLYTATISTEIADRMGNHLTFDYHWAFTTENSGIMPLAVGNKWVYDVTISDTVNDHQEYNDSIAIIDDTLVGNEMWFKDQMGRLYTNRADGLWQLTSGQPMLLVKYPANVGDSFMTELNYSGYGGSPKMQLAEKAVNISVSVGNFQCYRYHQMVGGFCSFPAEYYYQPLIGLIRFGCAPDRYCSQQGFLRKRWDLVRLELH